MPSILLILRVGLGLVLAVALINAARNYWRSRKAPYFILRQAALARAGRWLLVVLGAGAALAISTRVRLPVAPEAAPPQPATLVEVTPPTLLATAAAPSSVAPPLETPGEGPSNPVATGVPSPTPAPLFATRESDVTPQAGASLSIAAVSTDIGEDFLPRNPGTEFEAGASRFYVFFDFEGIADGVSWSGVVLVNRQVFQPAGFDRLWTMGEKGSNLYWWFDRDEGWPVGEYEVRFYIGDKLADSVTFRMVERASAAGRTPMPTIP